MWGENQNDSGAETVVGQAPVVGGKKKQKSLQPKPSRAKLKMSAVKKGTGAENV